MTSVARNVQGANEELGQASEYQRKAGRRALCLMIVLIIVVAIVLLAVCVFINIVVGAITNALFRSLLDACAIYDFTPYGLPVH